MVAPAVAAVAKPTRTRVVAITMLAWIAVIGADLLMNAGLLGPFLNWEQPGFLPMMKMFAYIPLGYAAFLVATVLLVWLMLRLGIRGARAGAVFGAKFGVVMAAAGLLGDLSIYAFSTRTLVCFAVDKAFYCIVVGTVVGAGLAAQRLRGLLLRVIAFVVLSFVVAITMQNLGLVQMKSVNQTVRK